MKTSLFRITAGTLLATSILFVGALQAAEISDNYVVVQTREVFYGDLDLQSEAGVARLHARIKGAAKSVCGDDGFAPIATYVAREKCRAKAIADAVSDVNVAQLTSKSLSEIELAHR